MILPLQNATAAIKSKFEEHGEGKGVIIKCKEIYRLGLQLGSYN
jgi:hypothetical protein